MPIFSFDFVEGNITKILTLANGATGPELGIRVNDINIHKVSPINLSSGIATFKMTGVDAGSIFINNIAAKIKDGKGGIVEYQWKSGDTDTDGTFLGQFRITVADKIYLVPDNTKHILKIVVGNG